MCKVSEIDVYLRKPTDLVCYIIMKIAVYCSARSGLAEEVVADARTLGQWIGSNGHTLVYGGLSLGLMDVVASATADAGGKVMGVVPQARADRQHPANSVNIGVTTLHERKQIMEENADVFVALDGGFGTLDEVMSALATMKFFKESKPIHLLNRHGLYTPLHEMLETMSQRHLASPEVASSLHLHPDIKSLLEALRTGNENY